MSLQSHAPRRFAALCLLLGAAIFSARAENVSTITDTVLAPLPSGGAIARLVTVGGQLFALVVESSWRYDESQGAWTPAGWRPSPGIVASSGDGSRTALLCADATDNRLTAIDLLTSDGHALTSSALPLPPVPLAGAMAAMFAGSLHVAGFGADGAPRLFARDLSLAGADWIAHDGWPGTGGAITSMMGQNPGLFVTQQDAAGGGDRLWRWVAGEGWRERRSVPGSVVAGGARAIGQAHVLYLTDSGLVSYHAITDSVAALGEPGVARARTATAWKDGIAWERADGNGGGAVALMQLQSTSHLLRWPDWIVLAVYLAGMTGIGLYFYLREKRQSTADFFVGSRAIPFWAVGISLYATNTSSISYIAIPAKAFETNWQYLTNNLVAVLGLMFVAIWIVPLLRRLDLMSVFHYLEIRFHPVIRTLASALCILVQIGSRLSVILFLPSLAIATITGIDVIWCILMMGVVTIAYTALGGMKAVIWTDFVQLFVMFGGAIFAIGFIVASLDGGVGEFFAASLPEDKMKLLDWSWDLTEATVWGFIFLVVFDVVLTFPKDQVLMQRVLSTRNDRDAGRSVWTFAAIMLPGGFLFYLIGTALYVFYQSHPERLDPLMPLDATFPLFIAAELPMGVTGLIIAGILAASMSTLSSIMNSVATLASVDFYERIVKRPDPKTSVRFAELMTVVTGLIGIGAAWLLSRYDIRSLFDVSIELAGLMGGGFAGAYTLGMFTRRANWQGVSIGIAAAIVLTTIAWSMNLVHPYFYLAISIMICIIVGYLASLLFPPPAHPLAGLTIYRAG